MTAMVAEEALGAKAGTSVVKSGGNGELRSRVANKKPATTKPATKSAPAKKKYATIRPATKTETKASTKSEEKSDSKEKEKPAAKESSGPNPVTQAVNKIPKNYRKIIVLEFTVGSLIILTSPVTSNGDTDFTKAIEQFCAFALTFLILALLANAGDTAGGMSAALGGLIVLTLMLRPQNINFIAKLVPPSSKKPDPGNLGSAIGMLGNQTAQPQPTTSTPPSTSTFNNNAAGRPVGQPGGVYNA